MQQFNQIFINEHLMPLLETILTDTRERTKNYLDELFISGKLSAEAQTNFMAFYFGGINATGGVVPFTGQNEGQQRQAFLNYLVEYIRSRGGNTADRIRAFLPVKDKDGNLLWPQDVKRNLFLMSYNIARKFEHDKLAELIRTKQLNGEITPEQAKKQSNLLEQGMLVLVKNGQSGEYDTYLSAEELKEGQTAVLFRPAPDAETEKLMAKGFTIPSAEALQNGQAVQPMSMSQEILSGISDQSSDTAEIRKNFQHRRGESMAQLLQQQGLEVINEVQFDANGHAMVEVKSGGEILLVAADTTIPFSEPLQLDFTFETGPQKGQHFSARADELSEIFHDENNAPRSAMDVYNILKNHAEAKPEASADGMPEKPLFIAPKGQLMGNLPLELRLKMARPEATEAEINFEMPDLEKEPLMPGKPALPKATGAVPATTSQTVAAIRKNMPTPMAAKNKLKEKPVTAAKPKKQTATQPPQAPGKYAAGSRQNAQAQAAPVTKKSLFPKIALFGGAAATVAAAAAPFFMIHYS